MYPTPGSDPIVCEDSNLSATGFFNRAKPENFFGDVLINGGSSSYTFTLENTGNTTLEITGTYLTDLDDGLDSDQFTITKMPSSTIAPGDSSTLTIMFTPNTAGIQETSVTIKSANPDTSDYTFTVSGNGISGY